MNDVSNDPVPSNLKDLFAPAVKINSSNTRAPVSKNLYARNQILKLKGSTCQQLVQNCEMRYQLS